MIDIRPYVEPVRKSVRLDCGSVEAFRAFTDDIASWWPLATHSVHQDRARTCRFDGERLVEVRDDGVEEVWAEVAVWEPGHRLVLRWHPGLPASEAQEVEVVFRPVEGGTLVELEHRDWRQDASSSTLRSQYEGGWAGVLDLYAKWRHWAPCLARERMRT